ncbi:MAG: tRNA (adenosine(37)-N6)-dimethylallyltransferase MiaA [Oscillospiraceae bacterium]
MSKIPVIGVVGPTASGKTKLAIELCKRYNGEVVSADSMQIYRYMSIGTARPTEQETEGIPHHMMGFAMPDETFSVAKYVAMAGEAIADIHSRGKIAVVAGGTGLYIDSLLNNIQFSEGKSDEQLRNELSQIAAEQSPQVLWDMLNDIDPQTAQTLHPNNVWRVIRAIEVYRLTGKTMYQTQLESRTQPSPYNACLIGINFRDRQKLYDRVNLRVDIMLEKGLIEEAKQLLRLGFTGTAHQAIGYKELMPYIEGELPLEVCVDTLKQESRRYAKRQLTWFRRNAKINWLYSDELQSKDKILEISSKVIDFSHII